MTICCSHNSSPLESSRKTTTRSACGCVCDVAVLVDVCAVVVFVVVVVVVVMVRAVVVLCVFCGCYVSIVMCPLLCVQCECIAIDRTNFVVFHPLTSFEVKTRTIFQFFRNFKIITRTYPTRVRRAQKNHSWISKHIQSTATTCIIMIIITPSSLVARSTSVASTTRNR